MVGTLASTPRWAFVASVACGAIGILANLFLVGFFALAYPYVDGARWGWLGFANDVVGIVYFALLAPVVWAFARLLPAGRVLTVATALALAATAGLVAVSVALVSGAMAFEVQVVYVLCFLVVIHGWLLVACSIGHRAGDLPRTVTRFGLLLGMLWPVALVLMLAGSAVGGVSLATMTFGLPGAVLVVPGLVLGMLSWLLLPCWPLLLAHTVFRPTDRRQRGRHDRAAPPAQLVRSHRVPSRPEEEVP